MAKKTKSEALITRNAILDSAEKVFHRKGVSRTSLSDIADEAGVTRGAIYGHFKNKTDVFNAMCERIRLPMETEPQTALQNIDVTDALAKLRELCIEPLKETAHNERRRRVLSILFHKFEFTEDTGPLMTRQLEAWEEGMQRLNALLHEAIASGQLPKDLDVRRAGVILQAYLTGLLENWLFNPASFDLEKDAEALINSYIGMLQYCPALRQPSI